LLSRILLTAVLVAGWAHSDVMYTLPAGSSYTAGSNIYNVSGFVDFFLTGCSGGSNCVLNIELENTQTGTEVANQAISGVTFELSNAGTALSGSGTTKIGSTITSTSSGGSVATIAQNNGALGSTNSSGTWTIQQHPSGATWGSGSAGAGGVNFTLDDHPASTVAKGMLVTSSTGGAGAPGTDSSFSSFGPSFMGPVYFQITGITGLSVTTDISNISILFGDSGTSNSPTGYDTLSAANCTAYGFGDCSTGLISYSPLATPEPVSFLLAGSGLLALACLRRRRYSVSAE
jgi:hypothetical protein